ncbi:MAG: MotA/TolQ/ExbB proton channel family protein [Candidatus Dadabacteria bacterium]|nr:MAG: MotA/TolQ/ExbB proton channel family protein [Candidatus Dadabacteria bacterium]
MWTLIFERLWYYWLRHPRLVERTVAEWMARSDRSSWYAKQIRRMLISRVQTELDHSLLMIKTIVAVCPLLGLLGTVTGMIEVFDVMAIAGSGNPRAMASGVSRATIPTMAGMVAALSGLLVSLQLERYARNEGERLAERLVPEEEQQPKETEDGSRAG